MRKKTLLYSFIMFVAMTSVTWAFDIDSASRDELKDLKYVPDQILVTFKKDVSDSIKEKVHKTLGALKIRESYGKFYEVVAVREGSVEKMVAAYSKNPFVEIAEPDYFRFASFTPNDEAYPYQWNFPQINIPATWNKTTGAGVTVAVLDTGVNTNGEDGFGGRVIQGHNFIKNTDDSTDDNGHGTHVAGTVGEETNNSIGCAGIAFDANILAVKVLNNRGKGPSSAITDGIDCKGDGSNYCSSHQNKVTN